MMYFLISFHSHFFLINSHCGDNSSYENQHQLYFLIHKIKYQLVALVYLLFVSSLICLRLT